MSANVAAIMPWGWEASQTWEKKKGCETDLERGDGEGEKTSPHYKLG